jgi:DNA modification methylase
MRGSFVRARGAEIMMSPLMPRLIRGDNLVAMNERLMEDLHGKVTLAYLDPPFMTQTKHEMPSGELAFDDRWTCRRDYIEYWLARIRAVRQLLAPHGSMVLHVDSKTSHYFKVPCDTIFGADHFASEIVWRYRRWPTKTKNFQRVHDTLLRYRRDVDVEPHFTQLYEPLAPSTVATWGNTKQSAIYAPESKKRLKSSKTSEVSKGVPLGDVWEDIGIIAPVSKERTGFPTQKPEKLLERLIGSLTYENDIVLDIACGSGTTLAVAMRMNRQAIGIDSSLAAIRVTKERLAAARARKSA